METNLREAWRAGRRWVLRREERATERRLGIETAAEPRTFDDDPQARNSRYEPLPFDALEKASSRLELRPDDVVYDLGCGKGRVVCWFARHPVKAVVGVEYDPGLAEQARRNAASMADRRAPIEILTGDAAEQDYSDATLVTLYNPFGAEVMGRVLRNLSDGLIRKPRPLRIVYAAPRQAQVFEQFPRFQEVDRLSARYDLGEMALVFFESR